jgi:hypothetical protein
VSARTPAAPPPGDPTWGDTGARRRPERRRLDVAAFDTDRAAGNQFVEIGDDEAGVVGGEVRDVETDPSHSAAKRFLAVAGSRLLLADQPAEFRDFVRRELGKSLHHTR